MAIKQMIKTEIEAKFKEAFPDFNFFAKALGDGYFYVGSDLCFVDVKEIRQIAKELGLAEDKVGVEVHVEERKRPNLNLAFSIWLN